MLHQRKHPGNIKQLRKLNTIPESAFGPDEDEEALLLMHNADYNAIYRRTHACGEELRPDSPETHWETVLWNPHISVCCSPLMKAPDDMRKTLPSKVNAWLCGRAFGAPARSKSAQTPHP